MLNLEYYQAIDPLNETMIAKLRRDTRTPNQKWAVTEQVDGDHIALYADAEKQLFTVATRNRFLKDGDVWSDWENVAKCNRQWVMEFSKSVKRPVIIYGKIIGGRYNKKGIGMEVKTVCDYCVHTDFVIHDIKVKEGFLSLNELQVLAAKFHITIAPILYIGEFWKVIGYPENKLSMIPFMYKLKPLYKNEMKGIIIRPVYDMTGVDGRRMILKKLNRKYINPKQVALLPAPPIKLLTSPENLTKIAEYIETEAMRKELLNKVLKELGNFTDNDIHWVAGKYVSYMLDNVNYVKYNLLNKEERRAVHKELNRTAVRMVGIFLKARAA